MLMTALCYSLRPCDTILSSPTAVLENMLNSCTKIHMYMVYTLLKNHEEYLDFI